MEKELTQANFFEISDRMLARIFQTIDQSLKNVGKRTNIVDEETNVSYCVSYNLDDSMIISVVDLGPTPNASLLPILEPIYGEPRKNVRQALGTQPRLHDSYYVLGKRYNEYQTGSITVGGEKKK
ncbi:hypothetical protein ABNC55_17855 [Paenibacillus larvae]